MKMFSHIAVFAFSLFVAADTGAAHGDVDWSGEDWLYQFQVHWVNKYITPSSGSVLHDSPSVQLSVKAAHRSGFYFKFWGTGEAGSELLNKENEFGTEIDIGFGWSGHIDELGLDLDAGVYYWALGDITEFKDLDTVFSTFSVSKTLEVNERHSLTPFVQGNNFNVVNDKSLDGFTIIAGVRHVYEMAGLDLFGQEMSLCSSASVIKDGGAYGNSPVFLFRAGSGINWKLNDSLILQPISVMLWSPMESTPADDRETVVQITTGFLFTF